MAGAWTWEGCPADMGVVMGITGTGVGRGQGHRYQNGRSPLYQDVRVTQGCTLGTGVRMRQCRGVTWYWSLATPAPGFAQPHTVSILYAPASCVVFLGCQGGGRCGAALQYTSVRYQRRLLNKNILQCLSLTHVFLSPYPLTLAFPHLNPPHT